MQLDRTRIAVKQRSWTEIADLSLVVFRDYWRPILAWSIAGALPFAILNMLILIPSLRYEEILLQSSFMVTEEWLRIRYMYLASILVFLEMPFAMQGVTYYLGQAVFVDKPSWTSVLKALRSSLPRSLWILGVLRMTIFVYPIILLLPANSANDPIAEIFLVGLVVFGISYIVRAARPFAPEIIVLEQCPLQPKKNDPNVAYFGLRSRFLHSAVSSDSVARMFLLSFFLVLSFFCLSFCERFVLGILFGLWERGWWTDWILLPLNLWVLAAIATVFRFLNYLDARIRSEGWEIELRFRAEAQRLEGIAP